MQHTNKTRDKFMLKNFRKFIGGNSTTDRNENKSHAANHNTATIISTSNGIQSSPTSSNIAYNSNTINKRDSKGNLSIHRLKSSSILYKTMSF